MTPTVPAVATLTDLTPDSWRVRRVLHPDAADLADLVDDPHGFVEHTLFRSPLLNRGGARRIERCADPGQLWFDVLGRGTRQPAFRLVRAGTTLAASVGTRSAGMGNRDLTDVIAPNKVLAEYRAGATVSLQGLHHTDWRMARLANNVALALDHPVQVNAYLSPPNATGLDLHFDFHDVLVVQLAGAKRWRVWTPLARATHPVRGKHAVRMPAPEELDDPVMDVELMPGDCLYLPRGTPHAAQTLDTASDHLTVGVVAINWQRVLRTAIDAEVAAGRLSESLPARLLEPGSAPLDAPAVGVGQWLARDTIRHWMAREIWRRQPATRWMPRDVTPLQQTVPLRLTPGPLLWLTSGAGRATLGLGDRMLDLPDEAYPFLADLLGRQDGFLAGDVAGLDPGSARVVLQRLMDEGVVVHDG